MRTAILALTVLLAVAGCAAPGQPFQKRDAGLADDGYSDVKLDAAHYSVSYSHRDAARAGSYLELRAAQIAQGAGFRWFAFDSRGDTVLSRTEYDLKFKDVRIHSRGGQSTNP